MIFLGVKNHVNQLSFLHIIRKKIRNTTFLEISNFIVNDIKFFQDQIILDN